MHIISQLATAGTFHTDGTYSILNAGIQAFSDKMVEELTIDCILFAAISPEGEDAGIHGLTTKVVDASDNKIQLQSKSKIKLGNKKTVLLLKVACTFKKSGKYQIWLEVDGKLHDVYEFSVEVKDSAQADPKL
jgi:hypothetical protein